MYTLGDAVEVETAATAVLEDIRPARIITTLYDLMQAIQTAAGPDNEATVVAAFQHVLRSGRATWHGDVIADIN
jgi:hypothetical protein